jgi:hypothetical protein
MNAAVLKQNNNVAFRTSEKHVYCIALDDDENCIGFIPVKKKGDIGEINNYYIQDRNPEIIKILIKLAEKYSKDEKLKLLSIIAQIQDYDTIRKLKFSIEKTFVKNTRFTKKI